MQQPSPQHQNHHYTHRHTIFVQSTQPVSVFHFLPQPHMPSHSSPFFEFKVVSSNHHHHHRTNNNNHAASTNRPRVRNNKNQAVAASAAASVNLSTPALNPSVHVASSCNHHHTSNSMIMTSISSSSPLVFHPNSSSTTVNSTTATTVNTPLKKSKKSVTGSGYPPQQQQQQPPSLTFNFQQPVPQLTLTSTSTTTPQSAYIHWRLDNAGLESSGGDLPSRNSNGIEKKAKKKKYGNLAFSLGDLTLVNNMNYQKPSMKNTIPPIPATGVNVQASQTSPRSATTSHSQHSSQQQASPRNVHSSSCISNNHHSSSSSALTPNPILIPQHSNNVQNNQQQNHQNHPNSMTTMTPSPTTPMSVQYSTSSSSQSASFIYQNTPQQQLQQLQQTQLPPMQSFPVPQPSLMYHSSQPSSTAQVESSSYMSTSTQSNLLLPSPYSSNSSSVTMFPHPIHDDHVDPNTPSPTLSPRSKISRTGISIKEILN
nr:unnamed protein product [Naegleria fowleri]